jgi:hypothetical protein
MSHNREFHVICTRFCKFGKLRSDCGDQAGLSLLPIVITNAADPTALEWTAHPCAPPLPASLLAHSKPDRLAPF